MAKFRTTRRRSTGRFTGGKKGIGSFKRRATSISVRPGRRTGSTIVDPRTGVAVNPDSARGRDLIAQGIKAQSATAAAKEAIKIKEARRQIANLKERFSGIGRSDIVDYLTKLETDANTYGYNEARLKNIVETEQKFQAESRRLTSLRELQKTRKKTLAERKTENKRKVREGERKRLERKLGVTIDTKNKRIAELIQKQRVAKAQNDKEAVTFLEKAIKTASRVALPSLALKDLFDKLTKNKVKNVVISVKKKAAISADKFKQKYFDVLTSGEYTRQLVKDVTTERKIIADAKNKYNRKVGKIAKPIIEKAVKDFEPEVNKLQNEAQSRLNTEQARIQSKINDGTLTVAQGKKQLDTKSKQINKELSGKLAAISVLLNRKTDKKIQKEVDKAGFIKNLEKNTLDNIIKANVGGVFGFSQYLANKKGILKTLNTKLQKITDDLDKLTPKAIKTYKKDKKNFEKLKSDLLKIKKNVKKAKISNKNKKELNKVIGIVNKIGPKVDLIDKESKKIQLISARIKPEITGTTAAALRKPVRAALAAGVVATGTLISSALPPAGAAFLSKAGAVLFAGYTGLQGYRIVKAETSTQRRDIQGEVLADVSGALAGGLIGRSISTRLIRNKIGRATFDGKVKQRKIGQNKYELTSKGNLKVGKNTIPTTEKVVLNRNPKTGTLNGRITTTYKLGKQKITKVTNLKGKEAIFKRFSGAKQINIREVVGTLQKVTQTGLFDKKVAKFATRLTNKEFTTLSSGKQQAIIKGLIKNLKSNKVSSSFNVNIAQQILPRKTLLSLLKGVIKSLKTSIKTAPPKVKVVLNQNLKIANKLFLQSKKAQIAIPRPGEAFKPQPRDFSKVNNILNNLQKQLKALEVRKAQALTRGTGKTTFNPLNFSKTALSAIFSGAGDLFVTKIIPIPLLPSGSLVTGIGKNLVVNVARTNLGARVIPGTLAQPLTEAGPVTKTVTEPTTQTVTINEAITTIPSSSLQFFNFPLGALVPGAIPFFGGGPSSLLRAFTGQVTTLPITQRFIYLPDLASRITGRRVKGTEERTRLLTPGRIFTGLEERKKI